MFAALLSCALPASSFATRPPAQARQHRPARAQEAIIGGAAARGSEFASVAEVFDLHGAQATECTGTVVAPSLILTAGHCAEDIDTGAIYKASGFRVLTGGIDGNEKQVSTVSAVIVYEGFVRKTDEGDAALLVLSTPTAAPPVGLAGSSAASPAPGAAAMIAGWGETHYQQRLLTGELQFADTVVQSERWCKRSAPPFYSGAELCTIDAPSYATGACFGDSGGPLLAQAGTGLVQIGIAVHVYGRCSTRRPSVFTSVSRIAPWVDAWIDAYKAPPAPTSTPAAPATTPAAPATLLPAP